MFKRLFLLACFCGVGLLLTAHVSSISGGGKIDFQVGIFDPTAAGDKGSRSPIASPNVSLDDHTLYTDAVWFDATLQVLDEDGNVVYTTFVPAGTPTVVLPSTLSGDYELQLIQGYWYFYGYITL